MTKPFQIEAADIEDLNDLRLTQLLKLLLHAEAMRFGIAQRAVEVALNIDVGDGGEDGRIEWQGSPDSTEYIPNRLTVFQNKATDMSPAEYAKEVLKKVEIKPQIEHVLSKGGSYIVFTTQALNTKQKQKRIAKIREAFRKLDKDYVETCDLDIYDASKIAGWVNLYISATVNVLQWAGRPIMWGMKTYARWSEHPELSSLPFASVESRQHIIKQLTEELSEPKACFRITGLSGLGKTRTAFQVFTENKTMRELVVYVDANHAPNIDAVVADWVSLKLQAILVVDNCDHKLHQSLVREVCCESSRISLLTLDYNFDAVPHLSTVFKLEPMTNDELLKLLSPRYKNLLPDLDRVVNFAQGFPQMAVLLADARLNEDPRIGELTDDQLAEKLLWKRGEVENPEYLKILQVCSLFDAFGIEQGVEYQLDYIAELVNLHVDTVYKCIQKYWERGLIERRGRFGQVLPKPLAIRLAGQWWKENKEQKQKGLIDGIPEGMVEQFCNQVEKMDFHPNVKLLTEKLCEPLAPFGQAEVILSNQGSRFFRAFVNVNPEATSAALYRILKDLDHQQLLAINGGVRRNLVWGLEKLCFHADLFMEAAWCMLLLASAECETCSNNATGMFAQLFRIQLSGTEAEPSLRFALLQDAMNINKLEIDIVILTALKEAICLYGSSRTIGAEYQGTKPPLKEWQPKIWQEIFDYWQTAFDLLLIMLKRGENQKQKLMDIIGHSIRGFVNNGRLDMLDSAINSIIAENGRYWPTALESIKNTIEYDAESLNELALDMLNSWLKLLCPEDTSLEEQLKIIVIDPPYEHHKEANGAYIDIAEENAKKLAIEIAKNISSIFPYVSLLSQGKQKQAYSFGRQLALELNNYNELIEAALGKLAIAEKGNPSFILGIYSGIYKRSSLLWQQYLSKLLSDKRLIIYYPNAICTGNIQKSHLDELLKLICNEAITPNSVDALSYGRVINNVEPETVADFCLQLATLGDEASWSALHIVFMYCLNDKERIEKIRAPIKTLVTIVPLSENQEGTVSNMHYWHDMAEDLLKVHDSELAVVLANQVIVACKLGFDYSALWHYIKPLLIGLMNKYSSAVWPVFAIAIIQAEGMELYWLQQLFKRDNDSSSQLPSMLTAVPIDTVILWCIKYPDKGLNFVASCINIFETVDGVRKPSKLFVALLEHFGNSKQLTNVLTINAGCHSGWGSLVPYLERDKEALIPLLKHSSSNVKLWVKKHINQIDKQIAHESKLDEEHDLGFY